MSVPKGRSALCEDDDVEEENECDPDEGCEGTFSVSSVAADNTTGDEPLDDVNVLDELSPPEDDRLPLCSKAGRESNFGRSKPGKVKSCSPSPVEEVYELLCEV